LSVHLTTRPLRNWDIFWKLTLPFWFALNFQIRFWVDSFFIVVRIINRLPTPILDNVSPFTKLYGEDPNYKTLGVFCCNCYPFVWPNRYDQKRLIVRSELNWEQSGSGFLLGRKNSHQISHAVTSKPYWK